jgi:hypothetical protein
MNLSSLQHWENKELTKLFHIDIQVKKTNIYVMFDLGSQFNLIIAYLVNKLGLEVHDHLSSYPLEWKNKDAKLILTKYYKIRFAINVDFIDEVELDVLPLNLCGVVFESPYMYIHDTIFM